MSAKHSKKGGQKPAKSTPPAPAESTNVSGRVPAPVGAAAAGGASAVTPETTHVAWMDSKGNLYTGEVDAGKRVQKFTPVN